MTINLNTMAKDISVEEGGAENLSIAQIKEVMRIHLIKLAMIYVDKPSEVCKLLEKIAEKEELY